MKDIQNQHDSRHIDIRKVGVKDLRYPISVLDRNGRLQRTVACISMYVRLPHQLKGTHMSRFVEILNQFHEQVNFTSCQTVLEEIKSRLEAETAYLEIAFPYFFTSDTSADTQISCQCHVTGSLAETMECSLKIAVPIQTPLINISNFQVILEVSLRKEYVLWIDNLLALLEKAVRVEKNNTVESLCQQIGAIFLKTEAFHQIKVTVQETQCDYQTCASMTWPDSRYIVEQSTLR